MQKNLRTKKVIHKTEKSWKDGGFAYLTYTMMHALFWPLVGIAIRQVIYDLTKVYSDQPRYLDIWDQTYQFATSAVVQTYDPVTNTWIQTGGLGMSGTDARNYANGQSAKNQMNRSITNQLVPDVWIATSSTALFLSSFLFRSYLHVGLSRAEIIDWKDDLSKLEMHAALIEADREKRLVEEYDQNSAVELVQKAPLEIDLPFGNFLDQTAIMLATNDNETKNNGRELRNSRIYRQNHNVRAVDDHLNVVKLRTTVGLGIYVSLSALVDLYYSYQFNNVYHEWQTDDKDILVAGGGCEGEDRSKDCDYTSYFDGFVDALKANMDTLKNGHEKAILTIMVVVLGLYLAGVMIASARDYCQNKAHAIAADDKAYNEADDPDLEAGAGNGLEEPLVQPQQAPGQAGFFGGACARMAAQIPVFRGYSPVPGNDDGEA